MQDLLVNPLSILVFGGTDRRDGRDPRDRTRETTTSGDLTATTNGNLFKVPAGNASTTLRVNVSTVHLDSERRTQAVGSSKSLDRTSGTAALNVDLPISRRGRDFSALGNLTLNGNAEIDQLSDFGTLTKFGGGANWSPVNRLNFITSWTREEGPPTINQLGDPIVSTPETRIFDFTTGQTVLVTAITGGNPNLLSDKRTVFKLGGYWQPIENTDLRLRADYVHQRIDRPISSITVTQAVEAAFPNRFVRCTVVDPSTGCDTIGQLLSVDLTPINFDHSQRDTLRLGFDFSKPLKSHRPSQAVLDQLRQQFGFGQRGSRSGTGGQSQQNASGAPPPGPPPEGGTTATGTSTEGTSGFGGRRGGFGGRGGAGRYCGRGNPRRT